MTERPIICSCQEVRDILDGRREITGQEHIWPMLVLFAAFTIGMLAVWALGGAK